MRFGGIRGKKMGGFCREECLVMSLGIKGQSQICGAVGNRLLRIYNRIFWLVVCHFLSFRDSEKLLVANFSKKIDNRKQKTENRK